MYPGIEQALRNLGGRHLLAAFGYGSSFNGESDSSLLDFIVVVDDIAAFHSENRQARPHDYDPLIGRHSMRLQTALNYKTPNFYPSTLIFEDGEREIKYGVIGQEDFVRQMGDSLGGGAFLVTAGRMAKVIYPFVRDENEDTQVQIDQSFNRARIDGAWLALGLLPSNFKFEEFALTYINSSYLADLRHEKPGKIQIILNQNREDYQQMLGDVLKRFVDEGILEQSEDGSFEKKMTLEEAEVRDLLENRGRKFAIRINFLKNMCLVYGIPRGIQYQLDKEKRVRAARAESGMTAKAPEDVDLDTLAADISAILEGRKRKDS